MEKKDETIWYEDELFWQTFGPEIFNAERVKATSTEVDQVTELLKLQPSAKVLDLCCGIGRHSLELARRGYEVAGLDRTASYLRQGQAQADAEGLDVDFVQCDMRRFCALEEFDAVLNLFTSFGYFEEPSDDRRILLNVYASLKPGGKFAIELMSKEILARIFQPRDWHENDGKIFLAERKVAHDWAWVDNRWILFEGSKKKEFRFGHRIYSAVELKKLLGQCGFRNIEVFGNLTGAPYDHEAQRLAIVAVK